MAGEVKAGSHGLRELQRRLKPGYHLEAHSNAKARVIGPDGEPVRLPDGRPLSLPNSPHPSDQKLHERKLLAAGVIEAAEQGARRRRPGRSKAPARILPPHRRENGKPLETAGVRDLRRLVAGVGEAYELVEASYSAESAERRQELDEIWERLEGLQQLLEVLLAPSPPSGRLERWFGWVRGE